MHYAWLVGCKFKGCEEQCQCDDGTTDEPLFGETLEYVGYTVDHVGYCYYDIVYTKNVSGGGVEMDDNQYDFTANDFAVIDLIKRLPEFDF